ncbi:MAG: P-type DNA transfer ATPase VirB11 [Betaproteobacteria bacterium]|nr:P-type DNA transfer ATPase VirB11 [Betaproteobacteria bacterium]
MNAAVLVKYDRSVTVRDLLRTTGIQEYMDRPGITEVVVNHPGEVLTEGADGWQAHQEPRIASFDKLMELANALAIFNDTHISDSQPIKSLVLPDGQRGQVVIPPATTAQTLSLTIRIPSTIRFTIDDYIRSGRLANFRDVSDHLVCPDDIPLLDWEKDLLQLKAERDMAAFWQAAINNKLNIVLVGGTGSGKTTFTKAIADLVPTHTRIVTLEDTHELDLPKHPNKKHLFYGKSDVTPKTLIASCMRMKPDRVFLTELRGDETWDYLSLLNTGHPGSITTVHANDCRSAFYRIGTLIKQSPVGQTLDFNYIMREVMTTLDVIAYFSHTKMTQLYFDPVQKYLLQRGK